jgi:hypothetical protein
LISGAPDPYNSLRKMASRTTTIERAFVSYFDILGFTSRFISGDLMNRYEKLIDAIKGITDRDVTIYLLSDSIIIVSEDFDKVKRITQAFYTWGILHDFWLRGAITSGSITRYPPNTIVREDKIILPFLGEGYLKAYGLESTLNLAGIIIDDELFTSRYAGLALHEGSDYVEYEEYLPKSGYAGRKRMLLPQQHSSRLIVNTMYFEEMLKSHVDDIDKYINTFCFYIQSLMASADQETVGMFLEKLLKELALHGRRVLIPSKVVIIFIPVIEGLLKRYHSKAFGETSISSGLDYDVSIILGTLKEQGYLATFIDYLLDYDRKRHTSLYKDINNLRSAWQGPA